MSVTGHTETTSRLCKHCMGEGLPDKPYQVGCTAKHPGPFLDEFGYWEKKRIEVLQLHRDPKLSREHALKWLRKLHETYTEWESAHHEKLWGKDGAWSESREREWDLYCFSAAALKFAINALSDEVKS